MMNRVAELGVYALCLALGAIAPASAASRTPLTLVRPALTASAPATVEANVGVGTTVTATVRYAGGPGFLDAVVQNGTPGNAVIIQVISPGVFGASWQTSNRKPVGSYRESVQFRMCSESPCIHPLAGASTQVSYRLRVRWASPGPWSTFQRNAKHDGFVPIAIHPSAIRQIWSWQRPNAGALRGVNNVTSEGGRIFVTDDSASFDVTSLHALDTRDGSELWRQDFGYYPALNPPAVANGRVYVATTGHAQTFLWSFDASDGTPRSQSSFDAQWPHVLAPTIANGVAYTNGGYGLGGIYAFDAIDGMRLWSHTSGTYDMTTPAVDGDRLYYYDGVRLNVHDAVDGTLIKSIPDPYSPVPGFSYHAAPMVGHADHVIAFRGAAYSGTGSADVEPYGSRFLVDYSPAAGNMRWRSAKTYKTHPAVADGVVYAGSDDPKGFDAISEATGQILWSWVPGTADTEFHRNVVLTRNLAFVSTNRAVYAIDLVTHLPVWSSPTPGNVAITEDGVLVVAVGARESTGLLIAFKLY